MAARSQRKLLYCVDEFELVRVVLQSSLDRLFIARGLHGYLLAQQQQQRPSAGNAEEPLGENATKWPFFRERWLLLASGLRWRVVLVITSLWFFLAAGLK